MNYERPATMHREVRVRKVEWNTRFYLGAIPEYDATKDKNVIIHNKRPHSHRRITATVRPVTSSTQRAPKKKVDLYNVKVYNALIDETSYYWGQCHMPTEMQSLYKDIYSKLPLGRSIPIISKEVEDLSKNSSQMQVTMLSRKLSRA
jgi:hypothetical protein